MGKSGASGWKMWQYGVIVRTFVCSFVRLVCYQVFICMFTYQTTYLPTYLTVFLSICIPSCLRVYLPMCLPIFLAIYLPAHLPIHLPNVFISICFPIFVAPYPSFVLSGELSIDYPLAFPLPVITFTDTLLVWLVV